MTTPFRNTRIEFHILQSFPVTCLNRDDVGAPKSATLAVCRAPECHRSAGSARCVWRCLILVFVSGCVVKKLPHCWPTPVAHWERAKNRLPDAVKRWRFFLR